MFLTSIASVSERQVHTKHGWRTKYDVLPEGPAGITPSYETWSVWHASLCERASKTGRRVQLGLRDTKWGPEIVSAVLL